MALDPALYKELWPSSLWGLEGGEDRKATSLEQGKVSEAELPGGAGLALTHLAP